MSPSGSLQTEITAAQPAEQKLSTQNKIDKISAAAAAYRDWKTKDDAASSRGGRVEQTEEAKLGERLAKEAEVTVKTANKDFNTVSKALAEKDGDTPDIKLSKFNAACALAEAYPPLKIDGVPEKTLQLLKNRPDLLENPKISRLYERVLLGVGQADQNLSEKTVQALKDPSKTEAIASEAVLEIAGRLSEADPGSQISALAGFIDGVRALNGKVALSVDAKKLRAMDRREDGYPLDRVLSITESGYLGLTVLERLAENTELKTDTTLSQRGRANMLGASFSLLLRSLENAETKQANPVVKRKLIESFAGTVDNLLGDDQIIRDISKDRNHPFFPLIDIMLSSTEGNYKTKSEIFDALNKRDLAISDRRSAAVEEEARERKKVEDGLREKAEEKATAQKSKEVRQEWEQYMREKFNPAKAKDRKFLFIKFGKDYSDLQAEAGGIIAQLYKDKPEGWQEKLKFIHGLREKLR